MKKILVPTDFSKYADNALMVASKIAKKTGSEIFLIHMLELPNNVGFGVDTMDSGSAKGASIPEVAFFLEKVHEKFVEIKKSSFLKGISVTEVVQFEKTFSGILKFSKAQNIDLIVMGSHGVSSNVEELIIGSNTEKVVRLSEIPVLVIKNNQPDFSISNAVFASDFSEETKPAFKKALNFLENFDSKLHLVTICTPSKFQTSANAEKKVADFIASFDFKKYDVNVYNDTSIEKGILNFTNKINGDLIIICTNKRTGLSRFFNGNISEDIINHAGKAVITFRK